MMVAPRFRRVLATLVVTALACSDKESAAPPTPPVADQLSVSVSPRGDSVLVGASRTFSAVVRNQFGAERAVPVTWSVVDGAVATIAQNGSVTGIAAGATQIVASVGSAADTAVLLVKHNVTSVTVLPNAAQVMLGDSIQLAIEFDQPLSNAELATIRPVWSTSDSSIAYVREDGQLVTLAEGDVDITVAAEGATGAASARIFRAPVASVIVSPAVASLSPGQRTTLTANVFDLFRRRVNRPSISWTSSNPAVATIDAAGGVTALSRGFAVITANVDGRTGNATITVGPKAVQTVQVAVASTDIGVAEETEASAIVRDSDGDPISGISVAWQSGNPSIATVDANGRVTGITAGTTQISAISGGKVGSTPLRVASRIATSLQFNPAAPSVQLGQQGVITVDVLDQNARVMPGKATYTSLNPSVVSINQQGIITGLSTGVAVLRATFGSLSATASATVTGVAVASVVVTPNELSLTPGGSGSLSAVARDAGGSTLSGRSVTWSSTDAAIATVSASGRVTAVSQGSALITASSEGKSASALVTVGAPVGVPVASVGVALNSAQLDVGESTQAVATVKDAGGNTLAGRSIQWSTSDADLATVSSTGLVTATGAGSVTIMATSEGRSGAAGLSVNSAGPGPIAFFNLRLNTHALAPGATTQSIVVIRDAAGNPVTGTVGFSSSKPSVAKVNAAGVVTGIQAGDAVVTASTQGFSDFEPVEILAGAAAAPVLTSIEVTGGSSTVQIGSTLQLTATPRDQNGSPIGTGALTWSSTNSAVATVNQSGRVSAQSAGSATIRASVSGVVGTFAVSVSSSPPPPPAPVAAITVSVAPSSVSVGQASLATVVLKDAQGNTLSGRTINYSSSNTGVATVATNGAISTLAAGTATISAVSEGKTGSAQLTVTGGVSPPPPPSGGVAETATLPQLWVNSNYVAPTGKTIHVAAGGNLQAAINSAARGDVVTIEPGASFIGPITLPNKPGTGWVTIRSAASNSSLPAEGHRLTPSYAAQLPKLLAPQTNVPALETAPGASYYRLMFLEVTTAPSVTQTNYLVGLGDPSANQGASMPSQLIIDRSYVHGTATLDVRRCILLSSAWTAVVDSYISDCHAKGFDSQAILGWNGTGPYKINNNYLEGAGENVMWGGATPSTVGLIPSDIEMRGNYFRKPISWKAQQWSIKNLFEIKFARRVLFESNVLDGNWLQAQTGYAINIKSSADFSWGVTEHVTLRNNVIRNVGAGISLLSYEGVTKLPANHITITDNIIEQVNTGQYTGAAGFFLILNDLRDIIVSHNTGVTAGSMNHLISFDGPPLQSFTFSHNVFVRGTYGIKGSGGAEGIGSLNTFAPVREFLGNVLIGSTSSPYPTSTQFAASVASVGFANASTGDYTLTNSSPYKGIAPNGRDPGANIAFVRSVTAGVP